jgi:RHS repeat-associated protein
VDNAGNRTAKTDQRTAVTTNYGYDNIYELLSATQGGTTTKSYTYDPVGNRLTSLGVANYTNNTSNELTSTSNASYIYDYNGNLTSKTNSTGTTNYTWDFENRLASVTLPGGGGTVSFKYDPFGRRIYKSSSSAISIYAYDGDNLIEEANSSGVVVARYIQGQNVDEPLAVLRAGTTSFYHADGLASITSLSNSSANITQTYTFDSFGNQTSSTGSLTNPFRYTGREWDPETSLYYYRARYYDLNVGRFISEDPIGFHGGLNYYRYVFNHAVNRRDPQGLRCDFYQPFDGHYGKQVPPPSLILPNGFFYYGNWGGPGWTGGSLKPYDNMTPDDRSHLAPPIDEQDVCYMNHDICYANARCNYKDCKKKENDAEGSCDMSLYYCLKGLDHQNFHSFVAQPLFSIRELLK